MLDERQHGEPRYAVSELTFGHRCDDRFVIHNDGATAVSLEYAIEKGTEHTRLTLGPRELVERDSKATGALELWMDGKLIAKALKENMDGGVLRLLQRLWLPTVLSEVYWSADCDRRSRRGAPRSLADNGRRRALRTRVPLLGQPGRV